jgi:hypothetical protein
MITFLGRKLQRSGVEHGLESAWSRLVRRLEAQQGDVGICWVTDNVAISRGDIGICWVTDNVAISRGDILRNALEIEPEARLDRKYLIMVGQQGIRPTLGIGSGGNELGLANGGGRMIKIKVRFVEKSEDELLPQ